MTAVSLSATLMASSFVVLRSCHTAWLNHAEDSKRLTNAASVLRHVVRQVRQATAVTAISWPLDPSGSLSIQRGDGSLYAWEHNAGEVTLSIDAAASQPLADDIDTLTFIGYQADGSSLATDSTEVQLVQASVTTTLLAGGTKTLTSRTWIRSW